MEIVRAEIENFMAIGRATLQLSNRGLVLISGDNDDDESASSNGAGKSSLADAICWCLFNETARGVTADAVVNRMRGKGTIVKVELVVDGEVFTVARHRKHPEWKNSLRLLRAGVDVSKGTDAETQKVVEQVLGCSKEVFRAAVYCGQEAMPDLPGMSDKFLKILVEEAAGITLLQRCYEIALERVREAKIDLQLADDRLDRARQEIEFSRQSIETATKHHAEWEAARLVESERLEQEAADAFETALRTREGLTQYDIDAIRTEIDQIDESLADYHRRVDERSRLEQRLNVANASLSRETVKREQAEREMTRAQQALDEVENLVGTACGECGKTYEADDLETARKLASVKVDGARDAYVKAGAVETSAAELKKNAQLELDGFVLPDMSTLLGHRGELQEQLREVVRIEATIAGAEDKYRIGNERVVEWTNATNPYTVTVEDATARLATAKSNEQERVTHRDLVKRKVAIAEAVVTVYGPAGVRAHILDTVTPYLNERTAHYLGALSDGNITASWSTLSRTAKGELREKFSITVCNDKGAESFAGFSGGEKRKTRLACALALQDLVASRATRPLRLFIGDELDDALDPSGLERFMGVLEEKARERGTVLIISHNDLADWIRDQVIVRKVNGIAEVSGSLCESSEEVAA